MPTLDERLKRHQLFLKGDPKGVQFSTQRGESIAHFDFRAYSLARSILKSSTFTDCLFSGCDFTSCLVVDASFQRCDFRQAVFRNLNFEYRELSQCVFDTATVDHAAFIRASTAAPDIADSASFLRLNLAGNLVFCRVLQPSLPFSFTENGKANITFDHCRVPVLDISGAVLRNGTLHLTASDFSQSDFRQLHLAGGPDHLGLWADQGTILHGARFQGAAIAFTRFEDSIIATAAHFEGCELHHSVVQGTDFTDANFSGATLYLSDFRYSRLTGMVTDDTTNLNLVEFAGCVWKDGTTVCKVGSVGHCI